ncbi:MAG: putrescine transport system ATP-binding protein, partial [Bradyrhizobium sp.]|nr:putrescine transport system ATP-binding protein [Bradyrhizobium sp.]
VAVAVRPEKVQIDTTASRAGDENCFVGSVAEVGYLGGVSVYKIKLDSGFVMKATVANRTRLAEPPIGPGDRVWLSFAPESAVVLLQ